MPDISERPATVKQRAVNNRSTFALTVVKVLRCRPTTVRRNNRSVYTGGNLTLSNDLKHEKTTAWRGIINNVFSHFFKFIHKER